MSEVYDTGQKSAIKPVGYWRWVGIICTFVVVSVSYMDRNNISIAASSIQREFHLSNVQLGSVFSAWILGYALSQPIAGRVADRFGATRATAGALLWWGLFSALLPFIPPGITGAMAILMAVRFLHGVGESIIFPASNRLVASWIPTQERGLANGIIFAGVGVGGALAPPLITYIMLHHPWRWAFWLCALIGFATAVVWAALVRNSPAESKHVRPDEVAYIEAGLPTRSSTAQRTAGWLEVLLNRNIAVLTLSYFCFGYVAYIFFTWFFKYLSEVRGLNLKASALYTALPFVAMATGSTLGGLLSDKILHRVGKRAARCGVAGLALLTASIFVWIATQVADAKLAALVLTGGAGALYVSQSAFWAISADIGGPSAGVVSGFMNMGGQLGGACTAALTPIIANAFGWTASFVTTAVVALVGAALWIFVDPFHVLVPRSS